MPKNVIIALLVVALGASIGIAVAGGQGLSVDEVLSQWRTQVNNRLAGNDDRTDSLKRSVAELQSRAAALEARVAQLEGRSVAPPAPAPGDAPRVDDGAPPAVSTPPAGSGTPPASDTPPAESGTPPEGSAPPPAATTYTPAEIAAAWARNVSALDTALQVCLADNTEADCAAERAAYNAAECAHAQRYAPEFAEAACRQVGTGAPPASGAPPAGATPPRSPTTTPTASPTTTPEPTATPEATPEASPSPSATETVSPAPAAAVAWSRNVSPLDTALQVCLADNTEEQCAAESAAYWAAECAHARQYAPEFEDAACNRQ